MKLSRFLPSQRSRTAGAFTALTLTLATLALLHDGTEVADLDLNDGGVWVTARNLAGYQVAMHLNYQSQEYDANTKPVTGAGFDLSQEANAVVVTNDAQQMRWLNTATWAVDTAPAQLPDSFHASQGKDVVAIADPNQGKVWAIPARSVSTFNPESTRAVLEGAEGVRVVTGKDDVIHTVVPNGTLRDLTQDGSGWVTEEVGSVPEIGDKDMQALALTAVGGTGAVYNPADGWVAWPGHRTDVDGGSAIRLQQPGDDVGLIALAGPAGLTEVPLDGGDVTVLDAPPGGTPIPPVTVGQCTYSAWSGTGASLIDCEDDAQDSPVEVYPQLKAVQDELVYRTSRDVVVLNNIENGWSYLVDEDMKVVNDMSAVLANLDENDEDQDDKTTDVVRRTDKNTRPTPEDDKFGVRPGHTATLAVLANDTDADGDVLLAQLKQTEISDVGELELVRDGRAVRITVDPEARPGRTAEFEYTANDGRENGTADAKVTLTIRGEADNGKVEPLVPDRDTTQSIRARSAGQHHILGEWKDADSDPFWVSQVAYPDGLSGTYRPDGLITYSDDGRAGLPAIRNLKVTLTDGRGVGGTRTVDLPVRVLPVRGKAAPVANADFVSTLVSDTSGEHPVTVRPLRNDTDPNGDDLYLSLTGKTPKDLRVVANDDNSLTITSTKTGTEYLEYSVTDGSATATSVVRVETLDPKDAKPVPDNDLAVLPPHGEALVNVLSNDTDPLGGVLVVESVSSERGNGITAEVVDHEVLKINDAGLSADESVDITYEVGNGSRTGTGTVTVVLDPARKPSAPVAADDTGIVRSGDILTVDVLDNDLSPTDLPLEVLPLTEDAVTEGADLGEAWVSENKLRFKATGESGLVRVQYTVTDPDLRAHSATVVITVVPVSGANSAPNPKPLTGRLVQGGQAEIRVPLEGVDPDGDSVSLVGLSFDHPPTKGSVTVDGDTLTYEAARGQDNRGTDSFSYVVEDEFGEQATGDVQIGIAAPPSNNRPPVALLDQRKVRPGRVLAVPVTANDIDPEGGALSIVNRIVQLGDGPRAKAATDSEGRVRLTTPNDEGTLTYDYTVRDDLGGEATAQLVVEVNKDAPLLPPVARDDRVPVTDVIGKTEVTVDVLRNDEDPDGAASELGLGSETDGVRSNDKGQLIIPVTPQRQVVVYTLTDPDDQVGRAVVVVPGSESPATQRPALRPGAQLPIEVDAGTAEEIPLEDYVVVREGRKPSLRFGEGIIAGPGHDGSPLKTADDTIAFGAEPDFYGPTAVIAQVSDSTGDDDADPKASTLTLPIFVNATGNTQPDLRVPAVTVAPQEPWVGDLDLLATDPDPGDQEKLRFEVEEKDSQLQVDLDMDERTITVQPESGARPSTYLFDLVVSDGKTTEVRRTVQVSVVKTTRPLIAVRDIKQTATAGEKSTVDIEGAVTVNPFEEDGKPVVLVSGPTVTQGEAAIDANGLTAAITPDKDYFGTVTATYVLGDATGLAERQVQGEIELNVRGYPTPPTTVTAQAGNAQVEVDWNGAEPHGAPIVGYKVEWQGSGGDTGSFTTKGLQTTYTATGLDNDTEYKFKVTTINEVGPSDASMWSRGVTPDYVPAAPDQLDVSFDDNKLHVTWHQPGYDGSPVGMYQLEVNGTKVDVTAATSATLPTPGYTVENGEGASINPYKIRVRGINDAEADPYGEPGASNWSAAQTEHPNGEPVVTKVSVRADPPTDKDPSAEIKWEADARGHPVADFEVRRLNGTKVDCTGAPTGNSCRITLAKQRDQQFQVRLFNRANPDKSLGIDGWGEWSEPTAKVTGATAPDPVRNLQVTPTGVSRQGLVSFDFGADEMNEADRVEFTTNMTGGTVMASGTGHHEFKVSGLTDGTNVNVTVTATTYANTDIGGGSATSNEGDGVNSFGQCTVNVTNPVAGYRQVTFDWQVTAHGRDCSWSGNHGFPSGSGGTMASPRKHTVDGLSDNQTVTLKVDVATTKKFDDDPRVDPTSDDATGTSFSLRSRYYNAGSAPNGSGNCSSNCVWMGIEVWEGRPGHKVECPIVYVGATGNGETHWHESADAADSNGYLKSKLLSGGSLWGVPTQNSGNTSIDAANRTPNDCRVK